MSELRTLHAEIEPFDTGRLQVSSVHELYPVHELYYEQCGNAAGKPVVFLHGRPGAGLVPDYRRFFGPNAYRVIHLTTGIVNLGNLDPRFKYS